MQENNSLQQNLIPLKVNKISTLTAFNTAFNVLLGSGPIFIPPVFQQPGILLAVLFIILIGLISFICAEYVIENISLLTAIRQKRQQNEKLIESKIETEAINADRNASESNLTKADKQQINEQEIFLIQEPIEYGQMGQEIFGNWGNALSSIILVVYLVGVLTSKTIATGSILANTFSEINVLDQSKFWIISFFTISVIFSFSDISKTKILQNIIVIVRFVTIAALFAGAFIISSKNSYHPLTDRGNGLFDIKNFNSFFSNLQFGLLMHHSIPSMLSPVKNQKDIKKIHFLAFGSGVILFIIISFTSVMAFGKCLDSSNTFIDFCKEQGVLTKDSYYNNYFKNDLPIVFYIASFYIFLNVAAFPVLTITSRNNLMKLVAKSKIPKLSYQITRWTFLFTIIIVAPIITISLITNNVQLVLDFTGGVFGTMLMIILPCTFVIFSRKQAKKMGIDYRTNPHTAFIKSDILPYFLIVVGFGFLGYSLTKSIMKYTT